RIFAQARVRAGDAGLGAVITGFYTTDERIVGIASNMGVRSDDFLSVHRITSSGGVAGPANGSVRSAGGRKIRASRNEGGDRVQYRQVCLDRRIDTDCSRWTGGRTMAASPGAGKADDAGGLVWRPGARPGYLNAAGQASGSGNARKRVHLAL